MFYPLPMPLSEHERRLLAEMEEALSLDDPRLVLTLTGEPISPIRNKIIAGGTLFLAGLAVLFGGLIAKLTVVGVLGFIVALSGVLLIVASLSSPAARLPRGNGAKGVSAPRKSFNDRLQERWDERDLNS